MIINENSIYTKSYVLGDNSSPGLTSLMKTPEYRLHGDIEQLNLRQIDGLLSEVSTSTERSGLGSKTRKIEFLYNRIMELRKNS